MLLGMIFHSRIVFPYGGLNDDGDSGRRPGRPFRRLLEDDQSRPDPFERKVPAVG